MQLSFPEIRNYTYSRHSQHDFLRVKPSCCGLRPLFQTFPRGSEGNLPIKAGSSAGTISFVPNLTYVMTVPFHNSEMLEASKIHRSKQEKNKKSPEFFRRKKGVGVRRGEASA